MDPFIEHISQKVGNTDFEGDRDLLVFKITMEIHSCHEKLKRGLRSEEDAAKSGAHLLLDYYRKLSNSDVPILKKGDITFFDAGDVLRVYSVQLDKTFPLIEYPYRLFYFHFQNLGKISEEDQSNIERINKMENPVKTKDFMKFYSIMRTLSLDTQDKLMIRSFFLV